MMLRNFLKEFTMNNNVWTLSILAGLLSIVGSLAFYQYSSLKSMERNIETAIAKGIDPLAVRCAYGSSTDQICVSYAANLKK